MTFEQLKSTICGQDGSLEESLCSFDRDRLGELAMKLKANDYPELALGVYEEICARFPEPGDAVAARLWRRDLSRVAWGMCRKDAARSSCSASNTGSLRFAQRWRHEWQDPAASTLDICSPVIARDIVIAADGSRKNFVGIELSGGGLVWRSGFVSDRLNYTSTPVYVRPWLYYATPPSIKRQSVYSDSPSETVFSSEHAIPARLAAPLEARGTLVFPFRQHILTYDTATDLCRLISVPLADGEELFSPVAAEGDVFVPSTYGRLFRVSDDDVGFERISYLESAAYRFSAAAAVGGNLVFEAIDASGSRLACAFQLSTRRFFSLSLEGEIGDPTRTHLYFPPVASFDGRWLLFSETRPRLYLIGQEAERLVSIPLDLDAKLPVRASPEFGAVAGETLITKAVGGFAHLNLRSNNLVREAFQPHAWDLLSQPVCYGPKAIFICREGAVCYDMHR